MQTFTDAVGDSWNLRADVPAQERVKASTEVDLSGLFQKDNGGIEKMINQPHVLVKVLAGICSPQIEERGLTEGDFVGRIYGDTMDAAFEALLAEIPNAYIGERRKMAAESLKRFVAHETKHCEAFCGVLTGDKFAAQLDALTDKAVAELEAELEDLPNKIKRQLDS